MKRLNGYRFLSAILPYADGRTEEGITSAVPWIHAGVSGDWHGGPERRNRSYRR